MGKRKNLNVDGQKREYPEIGENIYTWQNLKDQRFLKKIREEEKENQIRIGARVV